MCFDKLDPTCFDKMISNIDVVGIVVSSAFCLRPSFREKLQESWQTLRCKVGKVFRRFKRKTDEKSIV